ncbi:MAG: MBL fold metallo-hydrolase [Hyphomicrobiales bacterium]|nr:MBL fold metallo-hydrolase [Hyphomicrobiales bacterium]
MTDGMILNASTDEVRLVLRAAALPDDRLTTTFAPIRFRHEGRTVLIDTGLGPDFAAATGATAGLLSRNMHTNGLNASDVDLVVVSHFHIDHINGLLSRGEPVFPNAQIAAPEVEWRFWMDAAERSRAPEGSRTAQLFANAGRVFAPLRDRVRTYAPGEEIVSGLEAVATYGHSVGHMSFWLGSGSERVFVQSDLSNQAALFVSNPHWQSPLDQFPEVAARVRRQVYDRLAAERAPIQAFHHPFPGRCYLEKDGTGYRRIPIV